MALMIGVEAIWSSRVCLEHCIEMVCIWELVKTQLCIYFVETP